MHTAPEGTSQVVLAGLTVGLGTIAVEALHTGVQHQSATLELERDLVGDISVV